MLKMMAKAGDMTAKAASGPTTTAPPKSQISAPPPPTTATAPASTAKLGKMNGLDMDTPTTLEEQGGGYVSWVTGSSILMKKRLPTPLRRLLRKILNLKLRKVIW